MPFAPLLVRQPETNDTGPEEARVYLTGFIDSLIDFFREINKNINEVDKLTGNPLFEPEQIAFFPIAFSEINRDNHFDNLKILIMAASKEAIILHGLYGAQLRWKIFNVNFHLKRFIDQHSASLLDILLSSIDTLLDSILDAVSGGSVIKELIKALKDSFFRYAPSVS